jgi:hypothetical protein
MPPPVLLGGLDQPLDFFFGEIFPRARINCYILYRGSLIKDLPILDQNRYLSQSTVTHV